MDDCLQFECSPEMVLTARHFVRDRLEAWEVAEQVDSATLVASELVTNAVLHARTEITLRLDVDESRIRIEVYDDNPRLPVAVAPPADATSGRGLSLVSAVATAWGMEHRSSGKVVWAEIGPMESPPVLDDCVDLTSVNTVDEAVDHIRQADSDPASS
jgi:anti-sigma regulatory factor (Ser/Thr protein kinase)